MGSERRWFNYWKNKASEEINQNRESLHLNGRVYGTYVTTVFLLDTSANMAGKGLEQMKTAFKDIIHEFSQHPSITENVTVITCGRDVKVLQYYSANYTEISECVDDIECSGGSPLGAGIIFRNSGIWSAPYCSMGSFDIRTKIVIITCGKPTAFDSENDSGIFGDTDLSIPGIQNPYGLNKIKESIINLVMMIGRYNPIFVIPVGDEPDICFLGTMIMGCHGGKIIPLHEARQFGRYALNIILASKATQRHPKEANISKEKIKMEVSGLQNVSEKDLEDVCEIIEKKHAYRSSSCIEKEIEESEEGEFQEKYAHMPNVGTRVQRGPDWRWKNQDGLGAGTVIGHSEKFGWVNVEWDTGLTMPYRYGNNGMITAYDIEPCNEPRILEDQPIAVGCLVRRGPDWKWGDQDGGEGNIGAVYRLKTPTEVYVRWPNGKKSNYRFGYRNCYDVEICDPFDPDIDEMVKKQIQCSQTRHTKEINAERENITNASLCSTGALTLTITKRKQGTDVYSHGTSGGGCVFKNTSSKSIENVWQWRSPSNTWNDFPKDANDSIVDVFTKGKGTSVIVNLQGQLCRVNLKNNSMVNTITKETFDIRLWNENNI
ncbi:uncharacterized protein LOC128175218 isoform X1 [Crassostrea angulata]|uniref:uncharacterized protein LOC128175218 isoform X1 n=1 Tax=Magallana angulata TaxID=2784310 RepID=UPI0022B0F055|nr:uncharacterized protein LOC128175218 isoform X1 [Crassostrea angulata]